MARNVQAGCVRLYKPMQTIWCIHLSRSNCWLIVLFYDLRRFSDLSAILRLGNKRYPISQIVVARLGIKHRTSSQELNN